MRVLHTMIRVGNLENSLACVLPLLILSALFYRLFRETSRKNPHE